jgi:hypothetical protein
MKPEPSGPENGLERGRRTPRVVASLVVLRADGLKPAGLPLVRSGFNAI